MKRREQKRSEKADGKEGNRVVKNGKDEPDTNGIGMNGSEGFRND